MKTAELRLLDSIQRGRARSRSLPPRIQTGSPERENCRGLTPPPPPPPPPTLPPAWQSITQSDSRFLPRFSQRVSADCHSLLGKNRKHIQMPQAACWNMPSSGLGWGGGRSQASTCKRSFGGVFKFYCGDASRTSHWEHVRALPNCSDPPAQFVPRNFRHFAWAAKRVHGGMKQHPGKEGGCGWEWGGGRSCEKKLSQRIL